MLYEVITPDKLPGHLLVFLWFLSVDHKVMSVVGAGDVRYGIFKFWVWNNPPFSTVVKFRIVFSDSSRLVKTGKTHTDVIIIFVEKRSCIRIGWGAQVFSIRAPFLHEFKKFDPGLVVDDRFFAIIANELSSQLFGHGNHGNQIIRVPKVESSALDDLSVAKGDLF